MALNTPGTSSRRNRSRRGGFTDINVTPLVDVMLVLLIIFMVTAPMLTAGVEVDLPDSAASSLSKPEEPLIVSVDSSGNIFIQETAIEIETLRPKLLAVTGEKMDTVIYVRGDTAIDYGKVMRVMGEINAAGFTKVALLTDFNQANAGS